MSERLMDVALDAGRVSRYESGRITPSADALVRSPRASNISIDHLLIDDIPRRPLHCAEDVLGDRITSLGELAEDDLHLVTSSPVSRSPAAASVPLPALELVPESLPGRGLAPVLTCR